MSQSNSSSSKSSKKMSSVNNLRDVYADKQVGECFEFGSYPQGPNGEVKLITWRVLQREADYLLVIAENCLDCQPYHEQRCSVTWARCTLRRWLNSEFYNKSFNEQERKCILKTSIVNDAGPKTKDCVFLLSVDEVDNLFANVSVCCAKPTQYAENNGAYKDDDNGCCWWWLRSPGCHDNDAAFVSSDCGVFDYGDRVDKGSGAVRPALLLAL